MADTRDDAIARLERDIEEGRVDEIGQFLLEHLANWGPEYVDVQRLANRVMERIEES